MSQITLDDSGILQRQKSKTFGVTIKKSSELIEYWKKIHENTNWHDVHHELSHGKKSNKQLSFKMIGTGQAKSYCDEFMTEGCDNTSAHPKGMLYGQNRKLGCKGKECPICWDRWLVKETSRITERIEKYRLLAQRMGWRNTKPIHVIVSPPKWKQNISFTELKKEMRKMAKRAGWVIKNKGVRDSSGSVYSTVGYLLSHTAIAKGVSSVVWFGDLGYRAKYSSELKPDIIDCHSDTCPYCNQYIRKMELVSLDRPPPDKEWSGLLEPWQGRVVETLDEMFERKFWLKNQLRKRESDSEFYWNEECRKAQEVADAMIRKLTN